MCSELTDRLEWLPKQASPGTIWVGPWGELARIEMGGVTLLRSGVCGRPVALERADLVDPHLAEHIEVA